MLNRDFAKQNTEQRQYSLNLDFSHTPNSPSGEDYKPGVTVQSFSSKGQAWRVLGRTTGRVHQLMSKLEYMVFTLCDLNPNIVDIQEQFSHDLPNSIAVATKLGINHPPQAEKVKKALTTDLVVTFEGHTKRKIGIYVKYEKDLASYRTVEKLALEASSLASVGVPLFVVTEANISKSLIKNLNWILTADVEDLEADLTCDYAVKFYQELQKQDNRKLTEFLEQQDKIQCLRDGRHLQLTKCLIQLGYLQIDLNKDVYTLCCNDVVLNEAAVNCG